MAAGSSVPGTAVVVLLAVLPVPFLLRRLPAAFSVPALAPVLGLATLAGAFPGLAGLAPGGWRIRAALGGIGAWWLLLAEPLLDRTLLLGAAAEVPARPDFEGGAGLAADVVAGTVSSGLPLLILIWAIAAAVLPWLVRGRSATADVVMAAVWAAGLAAACGALAGGLGFPEPRGLVAGALVAGMVAVAGARLPQRRYFADERD
jgi:eukaryotic-like serine/threonine-protein kinase